MKSIRAEFLRPDALPCVNHMRGMQYKIQNIFLTAQSTQIKSVISVPIILLLLLLSTHSHDP